MNLESINLETLSFFLPTKGVLYRLMIKKDFFLPSETSKCITEAYLLDSLKGKIFTIKISEIKPFLLKKDINATKIELFNLLHAKIDKPLGFDLNQLPDRDWMVDVLHTLDPNNTLFVNNVTNILTRDLPEGYDSLFF